MVSSRQWLAVARKDFADAVRSKMFWGLSALMLILAYLGFFWAQYNVAEPRIELGLALLSSPLSILVPIIALIIGYMSIVSERQTGSIRLLLSLPLRRRDVFVGKFLGRLGVLAVPIVLAFGLAVPLALILYPDFAVKPYVAFVLRTLLLALVYVAVAVGVSGAVSTRGRALAGVLGIYVLFNWLWSGLLSALYLVISGTSRGLGDFPTWFQFLNQFAPGIAIRETVTMIVELEISTGQPLLIQEWVALLIVIAWIIVPLSVGYWRFDNATLS